jgi:4-diphosphocytidyl-2-C-methyl-D-erythritol kinase
MTLAVFAPAKVNLYLHVVGKRADGYHLLDSLAVFPRIGDSLTVEAAGDLSLRLDGPMAAGLQAEPDNIVLKAARALAAAAGIAPKAALTLTKRLPIASGIGGGSADGAAALRALCSLWRLEMSEERLAEIGLAIGADLPVCLRARPTQMAGIGEILEDAVPLLPVWMLLVNPGVALSTPAVFKARKAGFTEPAPLTQAPRDARDLAEALSRRTNDLMAPALFLAPVIAQALGAIAAQPGCLLSRMSGSGATCFGLFAVEAEVRSAVRALSQLQLGWWVVAGEVS